MRVRNQREAFVAQQAEMPLEKLVFLDESATRCQMPQLYGWSKRGEQAVMTGKKRGKRLSIIGAMALDGSRGHMSYEGTLDTDLMVEYVGTKLGPNLREGDIVVMDGLSVHRTAKVREAVEQFGSTVLILPPYSPELNPIEHAWSTLKARLIKMRVTCFQALRPLVDTVWHDVQAFAGGWIRHCGYTEST